MTSPTRPGTAIVKHSLAVAGHRTSISLEEVFWAALKQAAVERGQSVGEVVAAIDRDRGPANLSSAIRVHLFRRAAGSGDQEAADSAGSASPGTSASSSRR